MTRSGFPMAVLAAIASASQFSSSARSDEALFMQHCARCHPRAEDVALDVRGRTVEDRTAELQSILKRHHAEDQLVRDRIARYLAAFGTQ